VSAIQTTRAWRVCGVAIAVALAIVASGCGYAGSGSGGASQGTVDRASCSGCRPILSPQQVAVVQLTFPSFQPEGFSGGIVPTTFVPANFQPAEFFGPPSTGPTESTPQLGISVLTNGYDNSQEPSQLSSGGTYFTRALVAQQFALGTIQRSPLNLLEQRMGVSLTPDAATLSINLREERVSLSLIDQDMVFIRDQLAIQLPQVENVNPANAQIVIEPSIFYAYGTNFGNIWAGGLTSSLGSDRYLIQLADFYITFDSSGNIVITNWEDYLVDEAINFYVLSIGRSDLAR
jgi:hypothetical protein